MQFTKFNSIENSYQEEFVQAIEERGFGDGAYIVQEKVHGANFSLITDGKTISTAKRTGFIAKNDNFHNSQSVLSKYETKLNNLYAHLTEKRHIKTLTVFGEIFGGGYPHSDVENYKENQLVQRGIYYSPDNEFYAFDILINNDYYLDVDSANQLFEKFSFIYAKTLFKGSLRDCLNYSNAFKSIIPAEFNLPEIEGNLCEGVVIRPEKPLFFNNGSRVILKNKNESWSENNNYIDKQILKQIGQNDAGLSEEAEDLCGKAYVYISENRLENVISKIGEPDPKRDFGKVLGLFNKDILTDFFKEYGNEYKGLDKKEQKKVNKLVNENARKLVQKRLHSN
jgi:Rnl2 family RNA ligase